MPISNRINLKESLAMNRLCLLLSLTCGMITSASVAVWANEMPALVLIFHVPNAVLFVSLLTILMVIAARRQWLRKHRAVLWIAGHCFASTATIVMITEQFVFARAFIAMNFAFYLAVLVGGYIQNPVNSPRSSKTSTHLRFDVPAERAIPEAPAAQDVPAVLGEPSETPSISSFEPEDLYTPSNVEPSPSPLPTGSGSKAKPKPLLKILSRKSIKDLPPFSPTSLQSIESLPADSPRSPAPPGGPDVIEEEGAEEMDEKVASC